MHTAARSMLIILLATVMSVMATAGGKPPVSFTYYSLARFQSEQDTIKGIIEAWNLKHRGFSVKYVQGDGDAVQVGIPQIPPGNSMPDMFQCEAGVARDLAMRGLAADCRPAIDKAYVNDVRGDIWRLLSDRDGRICGLPFQIEDEVLIYNTRMFKSKNIEPPSAARPWSFADLRQAALKLTDTGQGVYGLGIPLNNPAYIHEYWGLKEGITDIIGKNGDGRPSMRVTGKTVALLRWLRDLVYVDGVMPGEVFADGIAGSLVADFVAGKYAILAGVGCGVRNQLINQCACLNVPAPYGVCPPPKELSQANVPRIQTVCVPARAENQKEIWEFLKYFTNTVNQLNIATRAFAMPARNSAQAASELHVKFDYWGVVAESMGHITVPEFILTAGWQRFCEGAGKTIYQAYFRNEITVDALAKRVETEGTQALREAER